MAATIPDSHKDLFERPVFVTATTILPDGQPQSTVVWVDTEGEYVRINTARGRQKDKNLARDPRITILSVSPDDPYHWIEVRGVAEVITEDGAIDHINKLAYKYNGKSYYGDLPLEEIKKRETRVTIKIRPHKVVTSSK